jgi:hypothetical protein
MPGVYKVLTHLCMRNEVVAVVSVFLYGCGGGGCK